MEVAKNCDDIYTCQLVFRNRSLVGPAKGGING